MICFFFFAVLSNQMFKLTIFHFFCLSRVNSNRSFNESNEEGWVCDLCTFQNKYTQRTCEACTMPFLSAGNHMDYNSGIFAPMVPSPLQPLPLQSQSLQPPPSYPLPHYMPMPMQMPYSLHNNNNNIPPYVHSSYYRPQAMPPQFYVYDTSRF